MFERITKREFIDLLKNHYSGLGVSRMNMSQKGIMKMCDILYNFEVTEDVMEKSATRKPKIVKSTYIEFDNGSRLYFENIHRCFRKGNMIFTEYEHYDSFDECYLYDIIAYIIGKEVE